MDEIRFEWDDSKNKLNIVKHKVSFDEAETVFYDEYALIIDDPDHSDDEERFLILGFSSSAKLLIVCHCYRHYTLGDVAIRIISARGATRKEEKIYSGE